MAIAVRPSMTGNDWQTLRGSDLSRRLFLAGLGIACLGVFPFLQGCNEADSEKKKGVKRPESAPVARAALPPIDLAAPVKTQTATFALG